MEEDEILEIIKEFLELQYLNSTSCIKKSYLNTYQNAIQGLLDLYCKEKARADKLEKDYSKALTKIDELEVRIDEYAYGEDL